MGDIEIHPVTPDRWPDLVELFERPGPRGAWSKTGACYCMFWRLEPAAYEEGFRRRSLESSTGGPNKSRMARVVTGDGVPGLVAYRDDRPIGWVSVSPRSDLVRLNSSRDLLADDGSADDGQTWSIACLYPYTGYDRCSRTPDSDKPSPAGDSGARSGADR